MAQRSLIPLVQIVLLEAASKGTTGLHARGRRAQILSAQHVLLRPALLIFMCKAFATVQPQWTRQSACHVL
jgi:hypothetical protein